MGIYKKISDFQSKVEAIKKKMTNPHYKSKYASLDDVLDAIKEPLRESGLVFIQIPYSDGLETSIVDIEDESQCIKSKIPYMLGKNDMQALGSAITYARRYALVSMLGLEQDDDDGNKACTPPPPPPPPPPPQTLKQYLYSQGFTEDEIKAFYAANKVTTADIAGILLEDKRMLNQLIKEFKEAKK